MFSKKVKETISFLIGFMCFILFFSSIINLEYLSFNTNVYKNFKRLVKNNISYYENILYSNNNYNLKKDEAKKILNCFINLKSNEIKSVIIRILITLILIISYFWFNCRISEIDVLNNNLDYINKVTPCANCFNVFLIIDIILIFCEIIDSIVMLNYRNKYLIPYMKIIISGDKFYSNMKVCKIFDILFIIIFFIFLFGLILFEIQVLRETKKYCCIKCCKENVQQEISSNQNLNQLHIYNANYNNNINDRNPRLVATGRNVNPGQYLIINNNQNSENRLNSYNNLNPDRTEIVPINNNENRNELNRNNIYINFNNNINNRENNRRNNRINNNENNRENNNINNRINNNENNRENNRENNNINNRVNNRVNNNENNIENNKEILIKKILEICNTDIFNSNKYKIDEVCSICLSNFENNDNIIILPCLHIFHDECMMDWLKKQTVCPLDKQNLENYL